MSSLLESINKVRALGIVVVKTARNTGINSDYASYADVWDSLQGALTDVGLSVGFKPSTVRHVDSSNATNSAWIQSLVMEVSNGTDTDSVTFDVLFPEGNRGVNLTQRQVMAHTYGKRYALVDYFHLIVGDDDDAQRLGQPVNEQAAPTPQSNTPWTRLCHVPSMGHFCEEAQGGWTTLADPSDASGVSTLGDLSPARLNTLGLANPAHPGLNAWRAELIEERAKTKGVKSWNQLHKEHGNLNLPEFFEECTGPQLVAIALALK